MGIETGIQKFIHSFEQGTIGLWLRRLLVVGAVVGIALIFALVRFNGFGEAAAMDQAQIGRQLAAGEGFTTKYLRPFALRKYLERHGTLPPADLPDTNQAPLNPLLGAAIWKLLQPENGFPERAMLFPPEQALIVSGFVFYIAALLVNFLTVRRLFDPKLALLATGLVVVMEINWRFAISGLPQMAMLFFFSLAGYCTVAALEADAAGRRLKTGLLAAGAGLCAGVLTLGHGLGLWIFAGLLLFSLLAFRSRLTTVPALLTGFLPPLLPWAWHNLKVTGQPFGIAVYEIYTPAGQSPEVIWNNFEPFLRLDWADFIAKVARHTLDQLAGLPGYLGGSIVVAAFFLAVLLHNFRRWQPALFRWAILFMWVGAFLGMSVFGVSGAVSSNQLHVLFVPLMTAYGLAFLLVLWGRLQFDLPFLRAAFLVVLFLAVGGQLLANLMSTPRRFQWPPYLPAFMDNYSAWMKPDEVLVSDIPWAVAWYADRKSMLLPATIEQFEIIHHDRLARGPLMGIYLTPYSAGQPTYSGIINGRYSQWARFIVREIQQEDISDWILRSAILLPIEGDSILYADRPRWRQR